MKIKFLGHACFLIDDGTYKILTDPFLTGNALAAAKAEDADADFIFVSHGHGDHVGDTESIAKRCGATVCSTIDQAEVMFMPAGLKCASGNIGGTVRMPFGSFKIVSAIHGAGYAGGLACGFVITVGEKKIYFAGDTALTMDMVLLKEEGIDLALLPIGDTFTMGPKDAIRAMEMIEPKLTIPMHYNTFPPIVQDAEAFRKEAEKKFLKAEILAPGAEIEI